MMWLHDVLAKKILLMLLILPSIVLPFSILGTGSMSAYAEFDKSGNYVCNPFGRSVETNIYLDVVHRINDRMTLYMKTNPNATALQQHDVLMQDQKTWDLYNKSRTCLTDVIGANPDDIISLTPDVQQAITVPEFGVLTSMVVMVAILGSIVVYRKFF